MARRVFIPVSQLRSTGVEAFRIVDVRYSLADTHWGRQQHIAKRPIHSVFADVDRDLSDPATPEHGRHPLPTVARFKQWCADSGIDCKKPVLALDTEGGALGACRLWWMLTTLGAEAYVLDGGWGAYSSANLPTESGEPAKLAPVTPAFTSDSWDKWLASAEEVANAAKNRVPLVDARPAFRYETTIRPQGLDQYPTSVVGSVNSPFAANLVADDPNKHFKPEAELRAQWDATLKRAGSHTDERIFMCASGVTACQNIATVVHLGHKWPRLYPGSWSQFSNLYKDNITKRVLAEHGLILKMHTNSLLHMTQPLAEPGKNCQVVIKGMEGPDAAAIAAPAVKVMRLGENATVTLRGGKQFDVQIKPLAKL